MAKKIVVKCYGPIAIDKEYESPWEDIWLSWTGKPGRKKYYLAPMLASKKNIKDDYQLIKDLKKEHQDLKKEHPGFESSYDDDIKMYEEIFLVLEKGEIFVESGDVMFPYICTPEESINRKEAEKMIAKLMKQYDFDNIICKWKRTRMVIVPV